MDSQTKEKYTVKEFAEIVGVSRQAIYSQLNSRLKPYVIKGKNGKRIKASALTEVEFNSAKSPENKQNQVNSQFKDKIENAEEKSLIEKTLEALTKELEEKNRQLESKDKQIEALNDRLAEAYKVTKDLSILIDQQQKLSLVDKAEAVNKTEYNENLAIEEPEEKLSFWSRLFKK